MEMLLGASLKVAMGNGEEDLKAIADVVAPNVWDDGLAKVLQEIGYID
jgi:hydroxymethylpyrimidine pyrophosphatase-like HAD family hydrolase